VVVFARDLQDVAYLEGDARLGAGYEVVVVRVVVEQALDVDLRKEIDGFYSWVDGNVIIIKSF